MGFGCGEKRGRLLNVEVAGEPFFKTLLGQRESLFLRTDVFHGDVEPILQGARVNIRAGDFRQQRHERVPVTKLRGVHISPTGLAGAPRAAEHVNLPRSIESGLIDVILEGNVSRYGH